MQDLLTKIAKNVHEVLSDSVERAVSLPLDACRCLLTAPGGAWEETLFAAAREMAVAHFGHGIFVRGLIEFSSYCRNDCFYCGLRRSNRHVSRYRLSLDEVLQCCAQGYALGLRTFVLQSGEDGGISDEVLAGWVKRIKETYPDVAVTLSVGERDADTYRRFREAGTDRYLLRHETRNDVHYASLHPVTMSAAHRRDCLFTLKRLGFQTGAGMMVGTPGQTVEHLLEDLAFLDELRPQMIGVGPFIPAPKTPFAACPPGSVDMTLRMLALLRLRHPDALIPSTTALATLDPRGRERGILAGANVVMPNLSPDSVRGQYAIYARKAVTGAEAAETLHLLRERLSVIGYHIEPGRGDYRSLLI